MADNVDTAKRYVAMARGRLSSARKGQQSRYLQKTLYDLHHCFSFLCAAGVLLDEAESEKGDG